jgi:hypothetical protein
MRRDLKMMRRCDEIAVDLRTLTSRRLDLAADRTRAISRMRAQMLEYFPAPERAFDYKTSKAALVLLTTYQTPAALRRIGNTRLATWLKNRKVRNYKAVAATPLRAADSQHTTVGKSSCRPPHRPAGDSNLHHPRSVRHPSTINRAIHA